MASGEKVEMKGEAGLRERVMCVVDSVFISGRSSLSMEYWFLLLRDV